MLYVNKATVNDSGSVKSETKRIQKKEVVEEGMNRVVVVKYGAEDAWIFCH